MLQVLATLDPHPESVPINSLVAVEGTPLEEMSPVDRNVLRLAIYEVLFDNHRAPIRVAINEAVEIAKGYGSESSGRFVNGVLGAVALEVAEHNESANQESSPS